MEKLTTIDEALSHIRDGMTIMLGGFFWSGSPFSLIVGLTNRKEAARGLTLISSDAATAMGHPEAYGNALIETGIFTKCIGAFMGHNHAAMKRIAEGRLELEMVPMGTFAERIRIGGAGIGGFLTPTGIGTEVADGKQIIPVDGVDYLLEKPLKADIALIYGSRVDTNGNVQLFGTARNYNGLMATAADYVIVEAREIVAPGSIDPSDVFIAAPFVDAIVPSDPSLYEALTW
jgi:acetate CoA/acetoacetate CoA-transferase alpha subunit